MGIIWNKKELNDIKRALLNKSGYIIKEETLTKNSNQTNFTESNNANLIYNIANEEIEKLFYIQDRTIIQEILKYLSGIEADLNNQLHYGLITCLSKIDGNDDTYVFKIIREIISQFERTISSVANEVETNAKSSQEILDNINRIKSSQEETKEEKQIKSIMDSILNHAWKLRNIEIFNSVINKCYNIIKEQLIESLNNKLNSRSKKEENAINYDRLNHEIDFNRKYQKKHLKILKESKGIFYK